LSELWGVLMNGQNHGGKGSAQRPVDREKYESNWDSIFVSTEKPFIDQAGTVDLYKENETIPESAWVWVVHDITDACNDFVGIFTTEAKADEFLKEHGDDSIMYGCVEEAINHPELWPEPL